jgi:hypothetical protein
LALSTFRFTYLIKSVYLNLLLISIFIYFNINSNTNTYIGNKSWVIRPLITDEWKGNIPILDLSSHNIAATIFDGGEVATSDDGINRIKIELCKDDIIIINTRYIFLYHIYL